MSAERLHDSIFPPTEETPDSLEPSSNMLIPLQRRVHERNMTDKEREMLDSFYGFSVQEYHVDPRHNMPADSEQVALSARAFLAKTIERRIETLKRTNEAQTARIGVFAIPEVPVERTIKWYYREYGYNRRAKSDELRAKEERWLEESKQPLYVTTYEGGEIDSEGNETPRKAVSRAAYFQEVALGIHLEGLLRKQGYVVAADSIEVLLAAYGAWFPQQRAAAIGRYGIVRVSGRDPHNVYRINEEDIPEELRAERPRYPRKR